MRKIISVLVGVILTFMSIPPLTVTATTEYIWVSFDKQNVTDEKLREMVENGTIPRNVNRLHLNFNLISDISPLLSLVNLEWLEIGDNQISNITPLSELISLQGLVLGHNQITDISPLVNLQNLGTGLGCLSLFNNNITDLSPLSNLPNLRWIMLHNNQITDLTPLENLVYLEVDFAGLESNPVAPEQIQDLKDTLHRNRASMNRTILTFGHVLGITPYTVNDAIAILRYSVGLPTVLNDCDCCDNDDGRCEVAWMAALIVSEHEPGVADAIQVLRHSAGLPSTLDERSG
jgi:hypothetical protein